MDLKQRKVVVYGNVVDLFVLLLAHYRNIDCKDLQMKSLLGYISLTAIYNFFGHQVSSALLPFHALTGCDVTGKFSGRSKEFWTKKFIEERNNEQFINALLSLNNCHFDEVIGELSSFICRSYCTKKHLNESQIAWLRHASSFIKNLALKLTNFRQCKEHFFNILSEHVILWLFGIQLIFQ